MELFSANDIMAGEDIDTLFEPVESETQGKTEESKKNPEVKKEDNTTTEVNLEKLFEEPESVGSDEENQEKEDTESSKEGSSPYIYSSIAKALKEEGIFPDLEDDDANKIAKPEDFANVIEKQIQAKFDERQKRIDDALNAGLDSNVVKQYENTIAYLNTVTEKMLSDEEGQGEEIRKQLIYQDYINRGFSKERAQRELNKSLENGTDIEDAKEALISNKDFFNKQYKQLIDQAKEEEEERVEERKQQAENLKKDILENKSFFGDSLSKESRRKIYDNISKPVYKDPDTGEYLTAIQKYESENRMDFLKYVGYFFTQTNGFKNFDNLVKGKVSQEVKKGLKSLEATLNNTQRDASGNLKFMSGVSDSESFFKKGFDLDV
jgi:hypothetical protein